MLLLTEGNAVSEDFEVVKHIRSAIKQGDLERVKALISADDSRLRMMTPFGTWLHVAASLGKLEIVRWLVDEGADVNAYGGTAGGAPLHRAASDGHIEVVLYLLDHGADLDVSEPERNPLFGAIHFGHTAIARLLIERGIDTKVRYTGENMHDIDSVAFAREWGRTDIIELLSRNSL